MTKLLLSTTLSLLLLPLLAPAQCVTTQPIGTAPNAYTNISVNTSPIAVNKDLNTVVFIHRNNPAVNGGTSGTFRYDISTNGGNSWTTDVGPVNPAQTLPGRYPQAAIYNPPGNTNPQTAFMTYMGACVNGPVWGDNVTGTCMLNGSVNTETYNQQNTSGFLIPYSMTAGAPGIFWATELQSDGNNNLTGGIRIYRGEWTNSWVIWSEDTVFSPVYDLPNNWFTNPYTNPNIAFDPTGQNGWISFLADLDAGNTVEPQLYPVFYKTTDGGTTWLGPIEVKLDTTSGLNCVWSNYYYPYGSQSSLTVDVNGNPHMMVYVVDLNPRFGLFDITLNGNVWSSHNIALITTAPSTPLSDNTNWHLCPEISRSADGTKIFYSWLDNTSVPIGTPNDNPNLFGRGFNVVNDTWTPVKDFTSCNPTCAGQIYHPQVASDVLEPVAGQYKIAAVHSVLPNMDPIAPIGITFLNNITYTNADFTISLPSGFPVSNLQGSVSDSLICLGDSVLLSASASYASACQWQDTLGNFYGNNYWIHPIDNMKYYPLAIDAEGCRTYGAPRFIRVQIPSSLAPNTDSIFSASCNNSHDGAIHLFSNGALVTGSQPFISEYYVGNGSDFAIEVYNPTGAPYDISYIPCSPPFFCSLRLISSAGIFNFPSGSIIPPYGTLVVVNPNASPALLALADYTSAVINGTAITGDVAYGNSSVAGWDVANLAAGQTTKRNFNIGAPNTTLTLPEWTTYPLAYGDLGSHRPVVPYNTPGVTIQWDVNAGSQTGSIASNLSPGSYVYTITYPWATCPFQDTLTVPSLGLDQFGVGFAATQVLFTSPLFVAQFNNTTPNIGAYNFIWDFGDGNFMNSNNASVFHQYMYNGLYTVSLIAEDPTSGCRDTLVRGGYIFCTGGNTCNVVATIQAPSSTTYCAGDTTFLSCNTNASYTYQWYNNGSPIVGATSPVLIVTQNGIYQVYITDATCTQISNQVLMMFYPAPAPPSVTGSGNISSCTGGTVTLLATPGYQTYLWSTGGTTNPITVNTSGNYTVAGSDQNGCTSTSLPYAVNISAAAASPVCYATVDSTSNYTVVIWDRPISTSIDSFRVYRETMTNVYTRIGSVDFDSLTMYNDHAANPNVTSYRYKISALDTCGNETFLSEYHSTIHLQLLGMGNMQWTLYNIENQANPVLYYVVLRDDNNTGNFQPISSTIPGSNSTFTDINWATYPTASYRVEVIWSISCVPARLDNTGNFMSGSVSMSNIKNAQGPLNTNTYTPEQNWSVFPNPATDNIIVNTTTEGNKTVVLRDASGRLVLSWIINGTQAQLSLQGIANGVYFLSINGEANAVKKVIKE